MRSRCALLLVACLAFSGCGGTRSEDAGARQDGSVRRDAGVRTGACTSGPCQGDVMCIRNVTCVVTCGDTPIDCGCCNCAAGFIDTISCP